MWPIRFGSASQPAGGWELGNEMSQMGVDTSTPKKRWWSASVEAKSGRSGMRALFLVVLKDINIATKTPMPNKLLEYVTMLMLVNLAELETNSYGSDGPPKT